MELFKYDSLGNLIWMHSLSGDANDVLLDICVVSDEEFVVLGYSRSSNLGFVQQGNGDAILAKYKIEYKLIPETISKYNDLYLKPANTLELSIDSNQIVFDEFSYLEDTEKLSATNLVISSTLSYNVEVSIESDIIGTTYGQTIDNSILSIKTSLDSVYKNFSSSVKSVTILSNCEASDKEKYSIDIKLKGNKMNKFDIYKTVLKFEVEQI